MPRPTRAWADTRSASPTWMAMVGTRSSIRLWLSTTMAPGCTPRGCGTATRCIWPTSTPTVRGSRCSPFRKTRTMRSDSRRPERHCGMPAVAKCSGATVPWSTCRRVWRPTSTPAIAGWRYGAARVAFGTPVATRSGSSRERSIGASGGTAICSGNCSRPAATGVRPAALPARGPPGLPAGRGRPVRGSVNGTGRPAEVTHFSSAMRRACLAARC